MSHRKFEGKVEKIAEAMNEANPTLRVMALHALAYCERLFYLEEVEEIRVADAAVYAGRRLHEELASDEGEIVSLVLESERLGLRGKVDCLRRRDGCLIPYEHKRGRSAKSDVGPQAWPSDRLQVCAYTMLLEEHTGTSIEEARVRYHADNTTVRVSVDEQARTEVRTAVARARELSESVERPPVTDNDRLCLRCSLAPVCLPEEERLAKDEDWEPVRLFPPDRERQTIHVATQGVRIGRSGETLTITGADEQKQSFPVREVGELVIHGYAQISTQAIHLCASQEVGVHWFTRGGRYVSGLVSSASPVQRRIRQYEALRDPGLLFRLGRRLVIARVSGQLGFLLRASRSKDRKALGIEGAVQGLRNALRAISHAEGIDSLRGHEGDAGRHYFSGFPGLLRDDLDDRLCFKRRSRRPPRDPINALLSFGYALLYRDVLQAIMAVGLEPAFGFFHRPRSAAHPLALDLMELFRVPLWDMPLVASVNRLQWDVEEDFTHAGKQVWLSDGGRKKAIEVYERRKEDRWKHPVTGYSLSYARLIELEVRLLEKEWAGEPGLFARMRLR
ncbi:MAG: type I-MYXAN CRISPR-associated endonuclease Cas1 [Nitrospira sp.]|nr:type I-MYXAN CRISPR-associated endonuclease Cas1 [Nitrospira sp.]